VFPLVFAGEPIGTVVDAGEEPIADEFVAFEAEFIMPLLLVEPGVVFAIFAPICTACDLQTGV
jgi:hypothetical protein